MASNLANYILKLQGRLGGVGGYDSSLAAAIQRALYNKSDLDRSYQSTVDEAGISYDEAARSLLDQREDAYADNDGAFSSNGLLRSGIYAKAQGDVGEAYQQSITAAAKQRMAALRNAEDSRLSAYNSIIGDLGFAESDATNRAAEAAKQRELQQIQTQQANALLDIQRQSAANQQSLAQQQLNLYRNSLNKAGQVTPKSKPVTPTRNFWEEAFNKAGVKNFGFPVTVPKPKSNVMYDLKSHRNPGVASKPKTNPLPQMPGYIPPNYKYGN
jgi:hypothetical protein